MSLAVHHITSLVAVASQFDDANYFTLELRSDIPSGENVNLTLFFEGTLEPGKLRQLCDAINRVMLEPKPEPKPENYQRPLQAGDGFIPFV